MPKRLHRGLLLRPLARQPTRAPRQFQKNPLHKQARPLVFSSEPAAPGTSAVAPADFRGDRPIDNTEMPIKPVLFIIIGLGVLGVLSFAVPKLFKKETNTILAGADVNEIAASIGSKLARNRNDSAELGDFQEAEAFVANEANRAGMSHYSKAPRQAGHLSEVIALYRRPSDEYGAKADACLNWAREAPTDEVRLGCLALAQSWLRLAMRNQSGVAATLPRAPTL